MPPEAVGDRELESGILEGAVACLGMPRNAEAAEAAPEDRGVS